MASAIVASMLSIGFVLMWQGWNAARTALLSSAKDQSLLMARLVDERAQNILSSAAFALTSLSFDIIGDASTINDRISRINIFFDSLNNIKILSSIYVGYENGEFFLLRRIGSAEERKAFNAPSDAAFLLQTLTKYENSDLRGEWLFYDEQMQLSGRRLMPDYRFDPRSRPWYKLAEQSGGIQLSSPYVFFTTRNVGVTLSKKSASRNAVVAIDIELSELNRQMESLLPTPRTEVALTGGNGLIVASTDSGQNFSQQGDVVRVKYISDLNEEPIKNLAGLNSSPDQIRSFYAMDEQWQGIKVPLSAIRSNELVLYIAMPDGDLFQAARHGLARQALDATVVVFVLMLAGWFGGARLGRSVSQVTDRAERMLRFDFETQSSGGSAISEIQALETALNKVCVTIDSFLVTSDVIGREGNVDRMNGKVLKNIVAATGCSFGALYLMDSAGFQLQLSAVSQKQSDNAIFPEPTLPISAISGERVISEDLSGRGQMIVPLTNRQHRPIGLIVLVYPLDNRSGGAAFTTFVEKLSGALSSAIETRQLFEAQENLLDGFVRLVADAIDAKSPYTGEHCRRVPELAIMMVDKMACETHGPFQAFRLTDAQRYEFRLGAWLHDCGKVTSPEHIIDKATKLEAVYNRIHEIRTRFEVLWRDAEIAHLQRLGKGDDASRSAAERDALQGRLREEFAFVANSNIGGEFMSEEAIARIREIGAQTWLRHFDDRLGLSVEEARRLEGRAKESLPAQERLLADRPEHIRPWGSVRPAVETGDPANAYGFDMKLPAHRANLGEIHNLSIGRGTLTEEDRFKINDHVVQTYIMLKSLPWPNYLSRVPEIAATHHERMDGKGYPRRLTGEKLSTEDRVMAIADVFEALTAADRPYKPAKTLSQSLRIMALMCKGGHVDPVVFRYFLESRLWETYAGRHLNEAQRDAVDVDALCALIPRAAEAA
ncbi:HD domain-containing phosphohydrolase [Xanthobacter sp. V4C-4]|uniref:HD domain-containing phosphohydrolase n=1 Tax=Xanthobacter cornucopiae TaxID=3119924 RepID=UPI003728E80D